MTAAGAAAGAAVGAAAAAQAAEARRKEEEEMTPYSPGDVEGYEFKILRTAGKSFKDPLQLRAVLEEESQAGWEMLEKFDEHRIRFKRRVEWRDKDSLLDRDPYRVWVGTTPGRVAAYIILVCAFVLIAVLTLATVFGS
jgi:hypothetical protein